MQRHNLKVPLEIASFTFLLIYVVQSSCLHLQVRLSKSSLRLLKAIFTTLQAVESRNEETITRLIKKGLSVAETATAKKTLVSTRLSSCSCAI